MPPSKGWWASFLGKRHVEQLPLPNYNPIIPQPGRKQHLTMTKMITIDVAHQGKGEALTILELTEEQRERVK